MSLGAMTRDGDQSGNNARALNYDVVSFLGDDSYPTGGTLLFDALVQAILNDNRNVVGVIALSTGGYVPGYLKAGGGALQFFTSNGAGPAALAEVPNATDLSAITMILLVISR